ncbi:MAG TPA: hypothetical protein VF632_00820 [Longimicrobium sp.]|jgi:hypothetical protein
MQWPDAILGFLSGIVLAVLTAVVTSVVERRSARREQVQGARFQIYMKLLDLHSTYFWVTVAEMHGEETRSEIKERVRGLAWQIADQLRAADELKNTTEILDVLLSTRYQTAADRHRAMHDLLQALGSTVNPRYATAIHQISNENVARLADGSRGSAFTPGLME